jgi:chorismate mutase
VDTVPETRTDAVAAGRERIDRLDAELVRLITERAAVSAQVQAARRAAGGPRIVQSRENDVVGRWHSALGRPGRAIALALLELGRGPR